MKKLISFRMLKENCNNVYSLYADPRKSECILLPRREEFCNSKNCPIWKKLKTP